MRSLCRSKRSSDANGNLAMDHTLGSVLEQLFVLTLLILLALAIIALIVRHQGPPRPGQYGIFFALAAIGAVIFAVPAVAFVAVTALLALASAWLLANYSLSRLSYRRTLTPSRLFPGDEADLVTRLQNDKPLPLTWLTVHDPIVLGMLRSHREMDDLLQFSDGMTVRGMAHPTLTDQAAVGPFQEVVRRYHLKAVRRGVYPLGPARIESGDPFGFFPRVATLGDRLEIIVYPALYRSEEVDLTFWKVMGDLVSRHALFEDPLLVAGSREYRPGDSLRRVDWKATAREGKLRIRNCDPTTTARLMVVLNLKTFEFYWEGIDPNRVEETIRVAASLMTWALDRGFAVGARSNGVMSGVETDEDAPRLPPSANPNQANLLLEHLARLSFVGRLSAAHILLEEARRTQEGTSIIFVTPILTRDLIRVLTSRELAGRVSVVYCGSYPAPVVRGLSIHFLTPGSEENRAVS
jgi:uncharacterized protein (DUF58 family)